MADDDLLERLGKRLGRPAATAIGAEHSDDRYFIGEALLTAAALFLLQKYLDGFVEGLGLKKLGEKHAALALLTMKKAVDLLQVQRKAITDAIEDYLCSLQPHLHDAAARERGEYAVIRVLVDRGIPEAEARAIAGGIAVEIGHDR